MKISIIIPYHRGEAYLRDCLDSLCEQSYPDIEVLLVCDHVSAEDINFIAEYEDKLYLRIYHLTDKTGVAAARNLGLCYAAGDYVYFLDSDDYLFSNTLEVLIYSAYEGFYDIIYGKKKPTWFGRSVYFAMKQEQEAGDEEEEKEESVIDTAELNSENAGDDGNTGNTDASDKNLDSFYDASGIEDAEASDIIALDSDLYDDNNDTEASYQNHMNAKRKQAYRILVSKRKGIRNISVLNILFRRSFIEDNSLRFPEELIYFSDVPFLLEALTKAVTFKKKLSAIYIKRKHNDSINSPSLSQIKDPKRFNEFIEAYYLTVERIANDLDLKSRFDKKYVSYYTGIFAPRMKRSSHSSWRNEYFYMMSKLMRRIEPEVIGKLRGYKRALVKALLREDITGSINIVRMHLGLKKLKAITRSRGALAKFLYVHVFLKLSMKENWVLFESFFGKNYSDSPKYIYEYLSRNNPDEYKAIWVINKKTRIPYRHREIKRFSISYYYYFARCRYYVFNGRQPVWVVKRKGNIFLQTWHGTPLKKLVFDIEDVSSASPKYKQEVYKQSRLWDYLIAPNAFSSETFRRCFMYDKEMLETGYPRNDILHSRDGEELAAGIKKRLGIPGDKKTILYAPTWRDDEYYDKGQYRFELQLDLNYLREELGDEYILLLRTHYFIADALDVSVYQGFAYNFSKYDDISELYLVSDILITDYSSVFFDYAGLRRPMLFFTYDLEKYRDVLRGFYIDIEKEVPGPLLFTTDEVVQAIRDINLIRQQYQDRYDRFYKRFCEWEDGHASEKVVKSVFNRTNN